MKNAIKLFVMDLKKIAKTPAVLVILGGLALLPSFYAWFNLEATTAPIKAVIPISKPFGCHITKIKVKRKITIAKIVINTHLTSYFYMHSVGQMC